jgi:sodium/potassium-transporting ATPase subunit alpha
VGKPWYMILLKELTGPFSLLLWAAGIMNLVGFGISDQSDPTNLYLGIVLFLIVIFTAVFSYF